MAYPHQLPDLPYDYNALEPHIDEETMRLHHDKHHQTYVNKLNAALEEYEDLHEHEIDDLLLRINHVPQEIKQAVINHGGGHANHSLFWQIMSPEGGGEPAGELAETIESTFGSFDEFKEKFTNTALGVFGSGWAWLCTDGDGNLNITWTQNQDSPLMDGYTPILGLDMWEHAYYVSYRNEKAKYVEAWWNTVNWPEVANHYEQAKV